MTSAELERSLALTQQLRRAVDECIALASELRGSGALWSTSLVTDSRRLLQTVDYFEQEQRRSAAEAARLPEHRPLALPARSAEAIIR
jgi:hypothetical protein